MLAGLLKAPSALAPTNDLDRARRGPASCWAAWRTRASSPRRRRRRPGSSPPSSRRRRPTRIGGYFVDWVLDGLTGIWASPSATSSSTPRSTAACRRPPRRRSTARCATAAAKARWSQAAVVVLDASGAVRAMVGGRDHQTSPFNRAVNAHRQPGSAFKPFVYLAALEAGWQPADRSIDRPLRIGSWQPGNFDGKFRGPITLTRRSRIRSTPRPSGWRRRGPRQVVGDRAPARRGLDPAAGAVDRVGHLGGDAARAHRRLPAVRHRRHPPAGLGVSRSATTAARCYYRHAAPDRVRVIDARPRRP